jgi:hypothetical protein
VLATLRLAGKLQERAANRQGGQAPDAPPSDATPAAAPAGPPLTVVDIVRAAGTATSRPNEGASLLPCSADVCDAVSMRRCHALTLTSTLL